MRYTVKTIETRTFWWLFFEDLQRRTSVFQLKNVAVKPNFTDKPRVELRYVSSKKVNVVHEWGAVAHSTGQPGRSFVVGAYKAT